MAGAEHDGEAVSAVNGIDSLMRRHHLIPERRMPPRVRAFTLTELLVVVAILVLGVFMLAPALARTSPGVKTWQCLNNLKQWSAAMRVYASDNLDLMPRDGIDHTGVYPGSDGGYADANAWFNTLPPLLGERTLKDYGNGVGNPMFRFPFPGGKGKPWHCASASMTAVDVANVAGGGADGFFSYDMNMDLKKQTDTSNMIYPSMPKVAAFRRPSATVVFFDCAFNPRTEIVNASPQYNSVNPANRWRSFSVRHGNSGAVSFLDGHVSTYSARYVTNGASTYEPLRPDIIWNAPYRAANP
jgi:prepilin-type processing-associated H-X9-DG protein